MSRGRPSNPRTSSNLGMSNNEQVMNSVWHGLVDTLRLLPTVPPNKPTNDDERAIQLRQTTEEKATLDTALEKLSQLIALRKGQAESTAAPVAIPTVNVSTPSSSGPLSATASAGGLKRKRGQSTTASPGPSSLPHTTESTLTSAPSPLPQAGPRSATPGNRETGRQRKDLVSDHTPLQTGRKVAFKVPAKSKAEDDEWILATVLAVFDNRVKVQDADDLSSSFDTTLRSIIPLPDSSLSATNPSHPSNLEDFPKGSTVLGLYPDTTSFYRATVIAAPYPGTGMGHGVRGSRGKVDPGAKEGKYLLTFVDDGGAVHEVQTEYVVLYPS